MTPPPGPELDLLVAEAMGLVPCDGWERLMSVDCYHASGACYSTIHGVPKFSTSRLDSPTLGDLPVGCGLRRTQEDEWKVTLLERMFGEIPVVFGVSEPHVLCLAYLRAREHYGLDPRWTEANRWRPWQDDAARFGLTHEGALKPPWTPKDVLRLKAWARLEEVQRWAEAAARGGAINATGSWKAGVEMKARFAPSLVDEAMAILGRVKLAEDEAVREMARGGVGGGIFGVSLTTDKED